PMRLRLALLLALCLTAAALARVAMTTVTISEKKPRYEINVKYLKLSLPDRKVQDRLNGILKADSEQLVREFVNDFQQNSKDLPPESPPWSLEAEYELVYESARLLCLRQSGYNYTGGAHGSPVVASFVLDLKTGKRLQLKDMLSPGYLKVMSDYSRKELARNPDYGGETDWINQGTEPKEEMFPVTLPTEKGLLIVFPPYQVAPYAAGLPEVTVPWSVLSGLIKPDGPLTPFRPR
ncbi:MAG: DUF3298 and DUF4163 domain-containing protein, partial [Candidatus Eremiobacterota bacterium]